MSWAEHRHGVCSHKAKPMVTKTENEQDKKDEVNSPMKKRVNEGTAVEEKCMSPVSLGR